jgi:hypothetical protein
MIRIIKKPIRDERGMSLVLALLMLGLGSLIVVPLLTFMGTGLIAGQEVEEKMEGVYAADAGCEHAFQNIKTNYASMPQEFEAPMVYDLTESMNGRDINVTIAYEDTRVYKVTSVATSTEGGSTTVESYVSLKTLWDNAIASQNDVTLQQGSTVIGDIYSEDIFGPPVDLVHDGDVVDGEDATLEWPTEEENEAFAEGFKAEAMAGVNSPWEGDYSIPQGPATVPLGPLYITGNLDVRKENTIVLTGTIYVEGSIDMDKDSELTGDGSIIAVGDIGLAKIYDYGTTGDATIMSLTGNIVFKKDVNLQALIYAPKGLITIDKDSIIYGAVIGEDVIIDKDAYIEYDEDIGDRTNLPFSGAGRLKVETWQIL